MPDAGALLIQSFKNKNFGLPIAGENVEFRPKSRTPYVELAIFDTGITPLTTTDTDEQVIILQAALNYPAGTGDAAIRAKSTEILDSYSFNQAIEVIGICANVTSKKQRKGEAESGWFKVLVQITFLVYSDRV